MSKDSENIGKLAIVTGASSGIGFELATQFAKHGFDLVICAAHDDIQQAATGLSQYGTHVDAVKADLSTQDGVETFMETVRAGKRPIDAAALNAGFGIDGYFWETDLAEEVKLINTNVVGTVHLAKLVVQDMIANGKGGKIMFTSSVASLAPGPYMACYNASKAFVQSFSHALHHELKEKGISVTTLMPDATDTDFFDGMQDTKVGQAKKDDPAYVAERGYEAMMEGKAQVLGGTLKHRLLNAVEDLIPEQTKAKMYGKQAKPGSAAEDSAKKAS